MNDRIFKYVAAIALLMSASTWAPPKEWTEADESTDMLDNMEREANRNTAQMINAIKKANALNKELVRERIEKERIHNVTEQTLLQSQEEAARKTLEVEEAKNTLTLQDNQSAIMKAKFEKKLSKMYNQAVEAIAFVNGQTKIANEIILQKQEWGARKTLEVDQLTFQMEVMAICIPGNLCFVNNRHARRSIKKNTEFEVAQSDAVPQKVK